MAVEKILLELKKNYMDLPDNLVGMDHHVEEMEKLLHLNSNGVQIVGIYGMGGIGKTTIAKVIYNQLFESFECCCFLEDVRETLKQQNGLVNLKNQFISQIGKGKDSNIEDLVRRKKVLIVLDDVDEVSQFDIFTGKWPVFGSGSRIILTTRNKEVLNHIEVSCQRNGLPDVYRSYEPQLMNLGDSLQLFCKHAFSRDSPPKDYGILSKEVVSTAAGLPLVLVTIGSLLFAKVDKALWEETLRKLKKIPHKNVMEKLRIGFDALDYEQKQIFLDIACLFVGEDIRCLSYLWEDCDFHPYIGIDVLILRSLIKVGDDNRILMHDHIRDLGRQIVREENLIDPGQRSRLWHSEEALGIFESRAGTANVVALCLDIDREQPADPPRCLVREDFEKLQNLRYLRAGYTDFVGDFKHLLSNLRWLQHWGCKGNFSLTNFQLKNLVVLHISNSDIEDDWEGWSQIKMATKLKTLNLSCCNRLISISHLPALENLERLILSQCENLEEIDPSIGNLTKLKVLDLSHCRGLKRVQCSLFKNLESLDLSSCRSLHRLDGIERLKSLRYLNTSHCIELEKLPDLSRLKNLKKLDISWCAKLIEIQGLDGLVSLEILDMTHKSTEKLPDLSKLGMLKELNLGTYGKFSWVERLAVLESLESLDMSGCTSLERKPELSSLKIFKKLSISGFTNIIEIQGLGEFELLELLDLSGCKSIKKLPDLSNLKKLKKIDARGCVKMTQIGGLEKLKSLEFLIIEDCESIEKLPDLSGLSNLKEINASFCVKLFEIRGLEELKSLKKLVIGGCVSIGKLPDLSGLNNLNEIHAFRCVKLSEIRGFEKLKSLEIMIIFGCVSVEKLPDLRSLNNLKHISISGCVKLTEIWGLEELHFLQSLSLSKCELIERLPDLSGIKKLKAIDASGCVKLYDIRGLEELNFLIYLNIDGCELLEILPDLSNLKSLETLDVSGCVKLTEIPGLEELNSLKWLGIIGCKSIEELPDLSGLTDLTEISASGCVKLTKIPGLERLQSLARVDITGCKLLEIPCLPRTTIRKNK